MMTAVQDGGNTGIGSSQNCLETAFGTSIPNNGILRGQFFKNTSCEINTVVLL